ncbi:hypothetical protein ATCC90586_006868 [Pythium insidiosum]|nr:hypothetical protein ATCC90586_006868 [Pythium insidiosum]
MAVGLSYRRFGDDQDALERVQQPGHDEKRELEEQVAGRVKNLRSMFEKGGNAKVGTADKKIARDAYYNKRVAEKEKRTKASYTQFKGALDSVENEALRRQRELRDAERKAEEDTLNSYRSVKSTKTLLDIAADEQKLREEQDRRMAPHDHVYTHAQKQREDELRAEREARDMLRNYSSGKSFFDEKLEEKRRKDDEERQKAKKDAERRAEQQAKSSMAKGSAVMSLKFCADAEQDKLTKPVLRLPFELRQAAAICIQYSWKCRQARKELSSLRIAASEREAAEREAAEREAAEREAAEAKRQLMAASVIQSSWKCRQARKELSSLRIAASEREAAEREAAEREAAEAKRQLMAASSSWKCRQARKELSSLRIAASEREAAEREAAECDVVVSVAFEAAIDDDEDETRDDFPAEPMPLAVAPSLAELQELSLHPNEDDAPAEAVKDHFSNQTDDLEQQADSDDDDDDEASFVDAHEVLPEILKEEKDEVFIQDQSVRFYNP